jgi:hypothetical protein
MKPYHERVAIIERSDRELNSPENRAREWDKRCDERAMQTVGEVVRVRFAMSEEGYRAYMTAMGWTGSELASEVFGPIPRRPVPNWFAVDRLGGLRDDEIAEHERWHREQGTLE